MYIHMYVYIQLSSNDMIVCEAISAIAPPHIKIEHFFITLNKCFFFILILYTRFYECMYSCTHILYFFLCYKPLFLQWLRVLSSHVVSFEFTSTFRYSCVRSLYTAHSKCTKFIGKSDSSPCLCINFNFNFFACASTSQFRHGAFDVCFLVFSHKHVYSSMAHRI